jgi:hypothetical protein
MIRWTLQYGNDFVTCAVRWQPETSTYRLSVAPNGRENAAITETFASGVDALRRHADTAAALRARGWKVIAYSGARSAAHRRQRTAA